MSDARKPPEYPPEYASETTGTRWLPIAEVEALIGKKERNARYWLARHDIPARGTRPKAWSERAILAKLATLGQDSRKAPERSPEYPPEYPAGNTGRPTGTSPEPVEAQYRVTPADVERAVVRTGARYAADLRAMLDGLREVYAGQVAAKDETIAAQRDALAELRRRAEAAEAERDDLRARLSTIVERPADTAPAAPGTPTIAVAEADTPRRPAGLWPRFRRALGGWGGP